MSAAQASRSKRALAEYDRYSFRALTSLGEYPVLVTSPKGSEYVVTVDWCQCEDKRRNPGVLCKHQEMVLIWLEREREWLHAPERCPLCGGVLFLGWEYRELPGFYHLAWRCGCGFVRTCV